MKFRSRRDVGLLSVGLLLLAGCSERGPKTVPVYGNVTFVGREAPKVCSIFFTPLKVDGPLRPSLTDRQPNGSYAVKAYKNSKGLIPGTYRVQVTYYDLKPGANPDLETSWIPTNYIAGELVVDASSGGVEHNIEVPQSAKFKSKS